MEDAPRLRLSLPAIFRTVPNDPNRGPWHPAPLPAIDYRTRMTPVPCPDYASATYDSGLGNSLSRLLCSLVSVAPGSVSRPGFKLTRHHPGVAPGSSRFPSPSLPFSLSHEAMHSRNTLDEDSCSISPVAGSVRASTASPRARPSPELPGSSAPGHHLFPFPSLCQASQQAPDFTPGPDFIPGARSNSKGVRERTLYLQLRVTGPSRSRGSSRFEAEFGSLGRPPGSAPKKLPILISQRTPLSLSLCPAAPQRAPWLCSPGLPRLCSPRLFVFLSHRWLHPWPGSLFSPAIWTPTSPTASPTPLPLFRPNSSKLSETALPDPHLSLATFSLSLLHPFHIPLKMHGGRHESCVRGSNSQRAPISLMPSLPPSLSLYLRLLPRPTGARSSPEDPGLAEEDDRMPTFEDDNLAAIKAISKRI